MLNRVVLIGRLTSDPELRYTPTGKAVATFTIAVDRRASSKGEKQTDFIRIVAWNQTAEFVSNYVHKGRLVSVDGRLQVRSWVAQDGTRHSITEVVAENLNALDRPKEKANEEPGNYSEQAPEAGPNFNGPNPEEDFDDPFADE